MADSRGEPVIYEDVVLISNGLVPVCEYNGHRFGMPYRLMEPGTTIRMPGDRGRLIVARAVVDWMGLVKPAEPADPDRLGALVATAPRSEPEDPTAH
jgi:hypothetical protein